MSTIREESGNGRTFKNRHTGKTAILLRVETLNDDKATRVYVLNMIGEMHSDRWSENLVEQHWIEVHKTVEVKNEL